MQSQIKNFSIAFALTVLGQFFVVSAYAADSAKFPNRPIKLIAPFAPGGALDVIARTTGEVITEQLGQPVVVENRAGAAGAIGSEFVAKQPPDGYTLLLGATTTHGINPVLQKLSYDPIKDFAPVSLVATIPHIFVVNPQLPVNSFVEFIAYAKSHPGLAYGSAGNGSPHHLAGELIKLEAGLDVVHAPYKGSGPALSDLLAGHIQFMSIEYTAVASQLAAGKLKALAVETAQRVPAVDLPTVVESGVPGIDVTAWYAVYAPAGTPAEIVNALQGAIAKGIKEGPARDKLVKLNAIVVGGTPDALNKHMTQELNRWARIIKLANIKSD
jgi:tripartite-type tricarboxylate transporter receptor subunit TctC